MIPEVKSIKLLPWKSIKWFSIFLHNHIKYMLISKVGSGSQIVIFCKFLTFDIDNDLGLDAHLTLNFISIELLIISDNILQSTYEILLFDI